MMGAKVHEIRVARPDARGETVHDPSTEVGEFLTTLAGYLGPSLLGLAGALLLVRGHVTAVLWLSLALLFAALVLAATWFTRLVIVVVGAIIVFVLKKATPAQEIFFAYTWVWFLLMASFARVQQRAREGGAGDYTLLKGMTYLPVSVWSGFYWLVTLASLVAGGAIMFGIVHVW
jgi:hypothetical protein